MSAFLVSRPPKPSFLSFGNIVDDIRNTLTELKTFIESLEPAQGVKLFENTHKFFFTVFLFGSDSQCLARREISGLLVSLINLHLADRKVNMDLCEMLFYYQETWLWEKDKEQRVKALIEAKINRNWIDLEGFEKLERAIRFSENKPRAPVPRLNDFFLSSHLDHVNGWMFIFWKIWVERFFPEISEEMTKKVNKACLEERSFVLSDFYLLKPCLNSDVCCPTTKKQVFSHVPLHFPLYFHFPFNGHSMITQNRPNASVFCWKSSNKEKTSQTWSRKSMSYAWSSSSRPSEFTWTKKTLQNTGTNKACFLPSTNCTAFFPFA